MSVPHRPAGKRLKIAAVVAAALFVAAGAFAGATVRPYLADRALVDTKLDIAKTAAECHHHAVDLHAGRHGVAAGPGGQVSSAATSPAEYRQYIDAIAATNKQAQVTNNTQVMGAAVESRAPHGSDRDRLHQFRLDQPGDEEHPVAALLDVPIDDGTTRRQLVDNCDERHHVARSDAAALALAQGLDFDLACLTDRCAYPGACW